MERRRLSIVRVSTLAICGIKRSFITKSLRASQRFALCSIQYEEKMALKIDYANV
jgi:hypothetical protein